MYNREMPLKSRYYLFPVLVLLMLANGGAFSGTSVRDASVIDISLRIHENDYAGAIEAADSILKKERDNPLGYFLLGTTYLKLSEEFRTDQYRDRITDYLDRAIDMAEDRRDDERDNPDWSFIAGASYGYRAVNRAFHGGWWGAFRDGLKASKNLNKALEIDSTYYDAYLGLGAYDYYRTVKSKAFLWLPFVSDKRAEGIEQIKIAIAKGSLGALDAREALLRIYTEESEFEKAIALGDSLLPDNPEDPYCLTYYTMALIGTGQFDSASERINAIRAGRRSSEYFDELGAREADYLEAVLYHESGRDDKAGLILEAILAEKDRDDENAYFEETLEKSKKLAGLIK